MIYLILTVRFKELSLFENSRNCSIMEKSFFIIKVKNETRRICKVTIVQS